MRTPLGFALVASLGTSGCLVCNELYPGDACGPAAEATNPTSDSGDSSSSDSGESGSNTSSDTSDTSTSTESETSTQSGTDTTPGPQTLYDIQNGSVPPGTPVDVVGVWVTATASEGFFAQEIAGGAYSGIYVEVGGRGPDIAGLAIGDLVDLNGVVAEVAGRTEIDASAGAVVETGTIAPIAPDLVDLADLDFAVAEPWESVFVRLEGNFGVSALFPAGFVLDATLAVNDLLYDPIADPLEFPDLGVGASLTGIQGIVDFDLDFALAPRGASDFAGYVPPVKSVDDLVPGDLVITEIMFDPNKNNCPEPGCEWIEVYNATLGPVELLGLRIQDAQLSVAFEGHVLTGLVVPAGGYVWIGHLAMDWPYAQGADAYMGAAPPFNNTGSDSAAILNNLAILDQSAAYTAQGASDDGVSWKLRGPATPSAIANDDPANWCFSTTAFDVDFGSPRAANESDCNPNLP